MSEKLTELQKVRMLYSLIGERGLYVNTNHDIFSEMPEEISLASGAGYKIHLVNDGGSAYSSPLLFATLTSLLNHGTMFLTGAPGIGKTTSAEFAGHFFTGTPFEDILAAEIKGNPQKTEEKMIARYHTGKLITTGEEEVLPRKFLQCPVKIVDEVNRMPADLNSILMDVIDTGKAIYGDTVLRATPGPLFATANYSDEGTFQLTPPFLDRFDVAVVVTSPPPWDLARIRERGDEKLNGGLNKLLELPKDCSLDFDRIRKEIREMKEKYNKDVPEVSSFADFVYASIRFSEAGSRCLQRATKGNCWQVTQDNAPPGHFTDSAFTYTTNESSIRTVKAMERYAKAYAWMNGRDKVQLSDLKTVLPYLLWHKLQPTSKALAENPEWINDRIAFIGGTGGLISKIEGEYTEVSEGSMLKQYNAALNILRNGKVGKKDLTQDEIRNAVKNAITTIGETDKPYASVLASHLVSEYNTLILNKRGL